MWVPNFDAGTVVVADGALHGQQRGPARLGAPASPSRACQHRARGHRTGRVDGPQAAANVLKATTLKPPWPQPGSHRSTLGRSSGTNEHQYVLTNSRTPLYGDGKHSSLR